MQSRRRHASLVASYATYPISKHAYRQAAGLRRRQSLNQSLTVSRHNHRLVNPRVVDGRPFPIRRSPVDNPIYSLGRTRTERLRFGVRWSVDTLDRRLLPSCGFHSQAYYKTRPPAARKQQQTISLPHLSTRRRC